MIRAHRINESFLQILLRVLFRIGYKYYSIEYRVDEDRFWFRKDEWFSSKSHHTKQDLEGSLGIIDGIISRSVMFGYIAETIIDNRDSMRRKMPSKNRRNEIIKATMFLGKGE
jgi:hypothetical protein